MNEGPQNITAHAPAAGHMLRALRGRNYALFFVGHGLSLIGTWMQSVALSVLIWKLTHQELSLGLVGFASQFFGFWLTPFAGVLSDRWNRHRLLLGTQLLSMVQATFLSLLTLSGTIQVWHIILLAAFLGLVNAVDIPTRQAFVVHMVHSREDLPNAIALNSFIFNGARLVGPLLAGILIPVMGSLFTFSYAGEATCFLLNAVSYLAVLVALLAMRLSPWHPHPNQKHMLQSLKEGVQYAFGFPPIRWILLVLALSNLVASPYSVLLPAIVAKVLHAGQATISLSPFPGYPVMLTFESTVGLLVASAGSGALLGAIFLARRKSIVGLGRLIVVAVAILGIGVIGFAVSRFLWLSIPLLLLIGFGFMVQMASSNTILQTLCDDDKRGRVMSFYTLSFLATAPIGALIAGSLSTQLGPQWTLVLGGSMTIAGGVFFATRLPALRRLVKPIYVRMGLVPEDAPSSEPLVREEQ